MSVDHRPRGELPLLSVAPMVDCTDRHFRWLLRQITRRTLLYTEMTAARAVLGESARRALAHAPEERPLALQLGGDDPQELARCARIAEDEGFDEVDLNLGCPSPRVQRGRFGACLMAEPGLVARCVAAMRRATGLPVTVKHRLGIDGRDRYEDLVDFVEQLAQAGCDRFIVHARVAVLGGLSPRENRTVPPLRYDWVHRLKTEFPSLRIELNGGIGSLEAAAAQLGQVDGVMIGRAAYDDPLIFANADQLFFGEPPGLLTRRRILEAMNEYLDRWVAQGGRPQAVTRHMLGLFRGERGARHWRRQLSRCAERPVTSLLWDAVTEMDQATLDLPLNG